jgi:hypothetical protein
VFWVAEQAGVYDAVDINQSPFMMLIGEHGTLFSLLLYTTTTEQLTFQSSGDFYPDSFFTLTAF